MFKIIFIILLPFKDYDILIKDYLLQDLVK